MLLHPFQIVLDIIVDDFHLTNIQFTNELSRRQRRDSDYSQFRNQLQLEFEVHVGMMTSLHHGLHAYNMVIFSTEDTLKRPDHRGILKTLQNVNIQLNEAAHLGLFHLNVPGQAIKFATLNTSDSIIHCPVGGVPFADQCGRLWVSNLGFFYTPMIVLCSVGMFYNVTSTKCESCPIGTYQPTEGAKTCLVCPEHTGTVSSQTQSKEECKGIFLVTKI